MVKFFVICLRKFFKNAYLKKCERNENLNFKFGFSVEFRVDWYVLIMDLYPSSRIFRNKFKTVHWMNIEAFII